MCKYCEDGGEVKFLITDEQIPVLGIDNMASPYGLEDWVLSATDSKSISFVQINYCPMCGRKLR